MSQSSTPTKDRPQKSPRPDSDKKERRKKRESISSRPLEKGTSDGDFRQKKTSKSNFATLLRRPEITVSDEPGRVKDETDILERQKVDGGLGAMLDSYYQPYGANIYGNLNTIVRAARSINQITTETEFVFIGWKGDGKSSLIEAILGLPLQPSVPTLRPVYFHVNQNSNLKQPRFALGLQSGIKHTTLEELPRELRELNKDFSTVPVHVLIERPSCVNMVLIDTPGLGGSDGIAKKAQNLIAELASPQRRYICVEAAPECWEPSALRTVVAKLDPLGSRTTFVYTMAYLQMRNFMTHEQALKYVAMRPVANSYLVDTLSKGTRDNISKPQDFSTRIVQANLRLTRTAESLGLSKDGTGNCIGLKPLLTELYKTGINDLEHQMPVIMDQIRDQRAAHQKELDAVIAEQTALQPHELRGAASKWAGSLGRALVALMHGTMQGMPDANGQTLAEERATSERWATAAGDYCDVDVAHVPQHDVKLYGVQQLQRLAAEFRMVAAGVSLNYKNVSDADVAVGDAAHPSSAYQRQLAAATIAARHATASFGPLVQQLFTRAAAIVERTFNIAVGVVQRHPVESVLNGTSLKSFDVSNFPFLVFRVRDTLNTHVKQIAQDACAKAMDDLRCFYFDKAPKDDSSVAKLAATLFEQMRSHTLLNVALKFQCFFVNRCAHELATAVHASLSGIPDDDIDRLFQTADYRQRLKTKAATLKISLRRVDESRNMLESRKVAAADPTIRKSFIAPRARQSKKPAARASKLAKEAKAVVEESSSSEEEEKAEPKRVIEESSSEEEEEEENESKPSGAAPIPPSSKPPAKPLELSDSDDDSEEDERLKALKAKLAAAKAGLDDSSSEEIPKSKSSLLVDSDSDVSDGSVDDAEVEALLAGEEDSSE